MMDPAGFEPATSCVASEVTDIFTTGRPWMSKRHWRGTGDVASPPLRGGDARNRAVPYPPSPTRRTRPLHHRQFCSADTGNRRHLGRRIILSDFAARALSAELQLFPAGGIRTRVLVVNSEVPDIFTTARQSGMSGNSRDGNDTWRARRSPFGGRPAARVTTPLAGAPPRYAFRCRCGRDSGAAWSEVSDLFTTDIGFQGNRRRGSFFAEGIRVFTTWNSKKNLLCFQTLFPFWGLAWGWKQKPLRSVGSGGVRSDRTVEERQLIRPSRESARVSPHRSNDPSVFHFAMNGAVRIINSLACCSDHRWQRARCMIGDRGEVKARAGKFSNTRSEHQVGFVGRGCFG